MNKLIEYCSTLAAIDRSDRRLSRECGRDRDKPDLVRLLVSLVMLKLTNTFFQLGF